eukprot:GHUV01053859.1.p1 GENE.GHUV01053859.1~~GHUV01053859.1.p1  ORF type:complete len:181 (-),score=57.66 GHUV01053859.1:87-629(-)
MPDTSMPVLPQPFDNISIHNSMPVTCVEPALQHILITDLAAVAGGNMAGLPPLLLLLLPLLHLLLLLLPSSNRITPNNRLLPAHMSPLLLLLSPGIDYKLIFIDMLISDELVMAWVDLNIKLAPFYIKRYHAPTIVMLRLRKCPDGLYRIYEQIDHHSVFAFVWALGWPFSTISDNITRP